MFGSVSGKRIRRSLDTVSWGRGEEIVRETDDEVAGKRFIADCESRKPGPETLAKTV